MKKLFTIICALGLVMAFTVPAAAIDDIDPNVAVNSTATQVSDSNINTGQAQDAQYAVMDSGNLSGTYTENDQDVIGSNNTKTENENYAASDSFKSEDNDLLDNKDGSIGVSDIANDKHSEDNDTITKTDTETYTAQDSFKSEDNDLLDNKDGSIGVSDIANDKHSEDNDLLDNKNGTIGVSDIANDKSDDDVLDNDGTIDVSDIANDKSDDDVLDNKNGTIDVSDIANDKSSHDNETVDMNDNMAAAAMGGFAIGVSIDDIELNLASTTSVTGISQSSDYDANALGLAFVGSEFKSEDHCVKGKVFDNVGLTGVNFTAGHFNNNANLNNVTMTVQY
jgi:hypothetical protein